MRVRELLTIIGGRPLLPDPLPHDPMPILKAWLDEAMAAKDRPNPNSVVLATATPDGVPSARVILCKGLEVETGSALFFTNYDSIKGDQLEANPVATMVFHWDHVERQARISGPVERATPEESDAYYATRPLLSRLGAWASLQSRPLPVRRDLLRQARDAARKFGVSIGDLLAERSDVEIPRPENWGGYRLWGERVELWCSGKGRLHDRAVWTRQTTRGADGITATPWSEGESTRLQP